MIQIIGDKIFYKGGEVAVLTSATPSLRGNFVDFLQEMADVNLRIELEIAFERASDAELKLENLGSEIRVIMEESKPDDWEKEIREILEEYDV